MNLIKTATLLMATAAVLSAPAMELTYQFDTENLTAAVSGWTGDDDTDHLTIPETAYCDQLGRTPPSPPSHPTPSTTSAPCARSPSRKTSRKYPAASTTATPSRA